MPRFQYVALDARGQESTGSVEANSANEAIGHLRQAGVLFCNPHSELAKGRDPYHYETLQDFQRRLAKL